MDSYRKPEDSAAVRPTSRPGATAETRARYRRAVEKAVGAMRRNVGREYTLQDMADEVYISPYHFNRIFRGLVGVPPRYFLSTLRIASAKRLLVETDAKVIDICFEVGFSSVGTFSRRFKDLVGVSPQHLRRAVDRDRSPAAAGGPPLNGSASAEGLRGRVKAPPGFEGRIFVGLFDSPVPQGRPLSCCVLSNAGGFRLPQVPDGLYYRLAAAYPFHRAGDDLLLGDATLRAGSARRPVAVRNRAWDAPVELELRPPTLIDPPILVALPLLLEAMENPRGRLC
jgi:AraC-like DNA-binding protein